MIIKQFEVSNFNVFCYLVGCEETKEALVIDPAAEAQMILDAAKEEGLTKIKYIVLTHGHIDHTMGAGEMKRLTGAEIIIHDNDKKIMSEAPKMMLKMFGASRPPQPDILVMGGDVIEVGTTVKLQVIHAPGHSPGGICLYTPGYVFTGDTLFVMGVGRTDIPGGSWGVLEKTIREKLYSLPDETIVLPGHNYAHKPTSTIGEEKSMNPFVSG
jgi:hydroxyacylglutathione hydrolase